MKKVFIFFFFFVVGCLGPHLAHENITENAKFSASLSPKQLEETLTKGAFCLDDPAQHPKEVSELLWAMAGLCGSGVREVYPDFSGMPGLRAMEFHWTSGLIHIKPNVFSSPEVIKALGNWDPKLHQEEAAWSSLAMLAHEVAHSVDPQFPQGYGGFISGVVKRGIERLIAPEAALKTLVLDEIWAEYFWIQILWEARKRVCKASWEVLLEYPGACIAYPPAWEAFYRVFQTGENLGLTLEGVFTHLMGLPIPAEEIPYFLACLCLVVLEAEYGFESPELLEFMRLRTWEGLCDRVDRVLAKRTPSQCMEAFIEGREALMIRFTE